MIRSCTLSLMMASALLASESPVPQTDRSGRYTLNTVWIEAGMGPGITDGSVDSVPLNGSSFDQSLDSDWQPGKHVAIEYARSRLELDGEGWTLGVAVWYDQAPGRITAASTQNGPESVDAKLELEILSVALMPSWTWRFDTEPLERLATRDWQFDLGPIIAVGMARATVENGESSAPGFTWQAGARMRLHGEITNGLRGGLYVGAVWVDSRTEWENTGPATFRGVSPLLGLILGYEL